MWYLMICQVLLWTRLAWWRKILLFVLQYRFQLFVHSMNLVLYSCLPPVVAREVSVWSWRRKYKCWQVQSLQYLTICLFFQEHDRCVPSSDSAKVPQHLWRTLLQAGHPNLKEKALVIGKQILTQAKLRYYYSTGLNSDTSWITMYNVCKISLSPVQDSDILNNHNVQHLSNTTQDSDILHVLHFLWRLYGGASLCPPRPKQRKSLFQANILGMKTWMSPKKL